MSKLPPLPSIGSLNINLPPLSVPVPVPIQKKTPEPSKVLPALSSLPPLTKAPLPALESKAPLPALETKLPLPALETKLPLPLPALETKAPLPALRTTGNPFF